MDFLFGKGKVKPTELVKAIKDVLTQLEKKDKEDKKVHTFCGSCYLCFRGNYLLYW